MKILVLGGTGAMGTPVVQILADWEHQVEVTTRANRKNQHNIKYIVGNARDKNFIADLLVNHYDAIIDFMIYTPNELNDRVGIYLENTDQYVFLSSARVYADSPDKPIKECSARLLDSINDKVYLSTNEYALAKAREEDILLNGNKRNFTVIRPYITYYNERLQLGVYEKEYWLQRVLNGKKIIFSKDIAETYTTLTYGYDVAIRIANLIGNPSALGEVFNIAIERSIKWSDVLNIYIDVLEKQLGKKIEVIWADHTDPMMEKNAYYQIHCDRLYNRRFSCEKIQGVIGENQPFIEPEVGLRKCLEIFLTGEQKFWDVDWKREAIMDRISGDRTSIFSIPRLKNKLKYFLYRYLVE